MEPSHTDYNLSHSGQLKSCQNCLYMLVKRTNTLNMAGDSARLCFALSGGFIRCRRCDSSFLNRVPKRVNSSPGWRRVCIEACIKNDHRPLPEGSGKGRELGGNSSEVGFVGAKKLGVSFTCTVDGCGTRISKMIRRSSYEKGTVLIQCPTCKTRHLISDHLGWYSGVSGGKSTIEEIMESRGEKVIRVDTNIFQLEQLLSMCSHLHFTLS